MENKEYVYVITETNDDEGYHLYRPYAFTTYKDAIDTVIIAASAKYNAVIVMIQNLMNPLLEINEIREEEDKHLKINELLKMYELLKEEFLEQEYEDDEYPLLELDKLNQNETVFYIEKGIYINIYKLEVKFQRATIPTLESLSHNVIKKNELQPENELQEAVLQQQQQQIGGSRKKRTKQTKRHRRSHKRGWK